MRRADWEFCELSEPSAGNHVGKGVKGGGSAIEGTNPEPNPHCSLPLSCPACARDGGVCVLLCAPTRVSAPNPSEGTNFRQEEGKTRCLPPPPFFFFFLAEEDSIPPLRKIWGTGFPRAATFYPTEARAPVLNCPSESIPCSREAGDGRCLFKAEARRGRTESSNPSPPLSISRRRL